MCDELQESGAWWEGRVDWVLWFNMLERQHFAALWRLSQTRMANKWVLVKWPINQSNCVDEGDGDGDGEGKWQPKWSFELELERELSSWLGFCFVDSITIVTWFNATRIAAECGRKVMRFDMAKHGVWSRSLGRQLAARLLTTSRPLPLMITHTHTRTQSDCQAWPMRFLATATASNPPPKLGKKKKLKKARKNC